MEKQIFQSGISEPEKFFLESIVGKEIDTSLFGKDRDLVPDDHNWDYSAGSGIKLVNGFARGVSFTAIEMMIAIVGERYLKLSSTVQKTPFEGFYYPVITVSEIDVDEYYDTNGFILRPEYCVINDISVYQDSQECPAASARYDSSLVLELNEGMKLCFLAEDIAGEIGCVTLSVLPSMDLLDIYRSWHTEQQDLVFDGKEISWNSNC